jgi:hypothetical protein
MWKQWLNLFLGLAVVAVPFVGLAGAAFSWTLAILGLAIAALALWSALEISPAEYEELKYAHHH